MTTCSTNPARPGQTGFGRLGLVLLGGLLGLGVPGAIIAFNIFSYSRQLLQMQSVAATVYPGSRLVMQWQTPSAQAGTNWETRLYETTDPLPTVLAYMEQRMPGFIATTRPRLGTVYLNTLAAHSPADWLNGWPGSRHTGAATTPRGVNVEIYTTAPLTPTTRLKIRTTWYEP